MLSRNEPSPFRASRVIRASSASDLVDKFLLTQEFHRLAAAQANSKYAPGSEGEGVPDLRGSVPGSSGTPSIADVSG